MVLMVVTLIGCGAALLARWGLQRLESDPEVLRRVPLMGLCAVNVGSTWVAHAAGDGDATLAGVVPVLLVGQLMMAAWIDRQTTWVPDAVLLPMLCLVGLHMVTGRSGSLAGLGLGVGLWLIALMLWRVQVMLDRLILTPPDMIAASLPVLLLGISFGASLVYLLAAMLSLAMLRSRVVHRVFANSAATEEGARHLGLPQDRPALPALSLFLPVLSIIFIMRSKIELMGVDFCL